MTLPFVDRFILPLRLARARLRERFVRPGELASPVTIESFDAEFDEGEAAYNGLGLSPEGRILFALSTKSLRAGGRLFELDPASSRIRMVADLDGALSHASSRAIPHGKIHVDLQLVEGAFYGATHVGYYDPSSSVEVPGAAPGYAPYPGGWFFSFHGERVTAIAQAPRGEGIISMTADVVRMKLYALTWPSGILLSLDLSSRLLRNHGPALGAAETGSKSAGTWTRVCRSLGIDPEGNVYWSDAAGRILRLDGETFTSVATTPRLEMWRKVFWHPQERAFYGVLWSSAVLFRFDPATCACEEIGSLRIPGTRGAATLAFALDANGRTIHALASGPGILRRSERPLASTVARATFDLLSGATEFSGPLRLADGRWVTQAQSLLLSGGSAYSICWVEVPEGDRSPRAARIRSLRRHSIEYRSRGYAEELRLVRITTDVERESPSV